jgi:hypothetical protein
MDEFVNQVAYLILLRVNPMPRESTPASWHDSMLANQCAASMTTLAMLGYWRDEGWQLVAV